MGVRALHHVVASSSASASSTASASSATATSTTSTASTTSGMSSPTHPSSAHVLAARYELKKANSESQLVNQLTNLPVDGANATAPACAPETVPVETPTSPDASSISPAMIKNATETDII